MTIAGDHDIRIAPVADETDLALAQAMVRAHGAARLETPGVEHVFADADRLPGPYVPPDGEFFLAWKGDEAAGCGALKRLDPVSAEVKRMYVRPEFRGRGIGRRILEQIVATARALGYERLCLGTLDDMLVAQALYRHMGFKPIERYRQDEWIDTRFYELPLHTRVRR